MAGWGWAEVSVISIGCAFDEDSTAFRMLKPREATRCETSFFAHLGRKVPVEPLRSCTIRKVLASPMPLPPGRVVKKSWKIFWRCSGGIPFPVSPTLNLRHFAAAGQL